MIKFVNKRIEGLTTMSFMAGIMTYVGSSYGTRAFSAEIGALGNICFASWILFSLTLLATALRRQTVLHGRVRTGRFA